MSNALDKQVGGDHYKSQAIQPVQFIEGGQQRFLKGCAIKRICRYDKPTGKGLEDLEKCLHELELSELDYPPITIEEFVEANNLSETQALAIASIILGYTEAAREAIEELKKTLSTTQSAPTSDQQKAQAREAGWDEDKIRWNGGFYPGFLQVQTTPADNGKVAQWDKFIGQPPTPAFNPDAACDPTVTQCPRCNNPHHACDTVSP